MTSITGLTTDSALTVVKNKIPDVSILARKTELEAELNKINGRVTSNKSKHLLVENELKNKKNLVLPILEVRIILMVMMGHKTI